jgi:hypothetical protein
MTELYGPWGERMLRLLVPGEWRDLLLGDLIEEAGRMARLDRERARRWFWWQVWTSSPPLQARRWAKGGKAMWGWRLGCALVTVAMGSLQAWDSGVRPGGTAVFWLVAAAIAAPALAFLLVRDFRVVTGAVVAAFVLLTAARLLSPVSLNTLHLAAYVPAMLLFFTWRKASLGSASARG